MFSLKKGMSSAFEREAAHGRCWGVRSSPVGGGKRSTISSPIRIAGLVGRVFGGVAVTLPNPEHWAPFGRREPCLELFSRFLKSSQLSAISGEETTGE